MQPPIQTDSTPANKAEHFNRKPQLHWNLWLISTLVLAALISLPILTVTSFLLAPASEIWNHLVDTVLYDYIVNSVLLVLGVGSTSVIIGVSTAWLTSMCEFSGRRILEWALLLPLAIPAYIVAFTYAGLLDPAGSIQAALRNTFNWQYGDYWFPEIRSLPGAIAILSLALYPYVYMLTRAAFLAQSVCVLEVSRTLGCGPWKTFRYIALPLARPAIAAGLALVSMETLADYGAVQFFGVSTFTTGIFRTWFGLGSAPAAAQLATMLMVFILALVMFERVSRRHARYHHTSNKYSRLPRYQLKGISNVGALMACLLPLTLGFLVPILQLLVWAIDTIGHMVDKRFFLLIWNSFWLASITAVIAIGLAVFLGYAQRLKPQPAIMVLVRICSVGYAIPGMVIAVGVVILSGWFDNKFIALMESCCNINPGLILGGSFAALVFTYLTRFLSVSLQSVEAGLSKLKPSIDDAARALGQTPGQLVRKVHLPVLSGTLFSAGLLVFVDVLKELPATLVMRPFNFNTLAVRAYELATDERLADASTAGLAIVLAGIIPVFLLSKSISQSRPGHYKTPS